MRFTGLCGFAVLSIFTAVNACGEIPAKLLANYDSPVPVGTFVFFEVVTDQNASRLTYRFSVKNPGEDFHLVRDFSRTNYVTWTALDEGTYEVEVRIRDTATGETSVVSGPFQLVSRITSSGAAVNGTDHPLVFLYSAPACPVGSSIRVEFRPRDGNQVTSTHSRPCLGEGSMNFWLAGLRNYSQFVARHIVDNVASAHELEFQTGADIQLTFFPQTPIAGPSQESGYRYVLHSALGERPSATDLDGNLVWYYPGWLTSLTRIEQDGRLWGFVQDLSGPPEAQLLREFDLAGITLRETDAASINEQLKALGLRTITGFHHEVRSLPGGKVLALASTEQILTDVQGDGQVDVLGDMILVLDANLQVEWAWDAFDHLDVKRMSTLPHICSSPSGGCPAYSLMPNANDWTHGNALQLTPDGNILFSMRHMDWLAKIDYANGQGSGRIIWRLGREGDFTPISDDPSPWFSHQHDGAILEDGRLLVFDNGNYRWDSDNSVKSRGQVWRLDEVGRTAKLELNADLGAYSSALGSAQALAHGYHFGLGLMPNRAARAIETDHQGKTTYSLETPSMVYRSFRLKSLYMKP